MLLWINLPIAIVIWVPCSCTEDEDKKREKKYRLFEYFIQTSANCELFDAYGFNVVRKGTKRNGRPYWLCSWTKYFKFITHHNRTCDVKMFKWLQVCYNDSPSKNRRIHMKTERNGTERNGTNIIFYFNSLFHLSQCCE